ncbi:hypothetical protein [Streptomyces sp. NPDC002265]|uniref:hypothetical protein n=1 Tax=Streptomyces sp. NPDC002265 TaxID=3154415 RepID=UPI00331EA933
MSSTWDVQAGDPDGVAGADAPGGVLDGALGNASEGLPADVSADGDTVEAPPVPPCCAPQPARRSVAVATVVTVVRWSVVRRMG